MTEKKRTADLYKIVQKLPRGSLVICRLYDEKNSQQALETAQKLRAITRQRGLALLVAGDSMLAQKIGADGLHLPSYQLRQRPPSSLKIWSAACHTKADIARAKALGIPLKLVSPVFHTPSHPGAKPLGIHRFARLTAGLAGTIALGGITLKTLRKLPKRTLAGFAAISGWQDIVGD